MQVYKVVWYKNRSICGYRSFTKHSDAMLLAHEKEEAGYHCEIFKIGSFSTTRVYKTIKLKGAF